MSKVFKGLLYFATIIVVIDLIFALFQTIVTGSLVEPFIGRMFKKIILLFLGSVFSVILIIRSPFFGEDVWTAMLDLFKLWFYFLGESMGDLSGVVIGIIKLPWTLIGFLVSTITGSTEISTGLGEKGVLGFFGDISIDISTLSFYGYVYTVPVGAKLGVAFVVSIFGDTLTLAGVQYILSPISMNLGLGVVVDWAKLELSAWDFFIKPVLDAFEPLSVTDFENIVKEIAKRF